MLFESPGLVLDDIDTIVESSKSDSEQDDQGSPPPSQVPARKLCVRHQRMADEGTNLKLQQVGCSPIGTPYHTNRYLAVSRCFAFTRA